SPLGRFCWTSDAVCAHIDPSYVRGGSPLGQVWFSFVFLLTLSLLGLLLSSIYQRFGRLGSYTFVGGAFLLLCVFLLLSSYLGWWGAIFGWLAQQTVTTLSVWLLPLVALCALGSLALLQRATV